MAPFTEARSRVLSTYSARSGKLRERREMPTSGCPLSPNGRHFVLYDDGDEGWCTWCASNQRMEEGDTACLNPATGCQKQPKTRKKPETMNRQRIEVRATETRGRCNGRMFEMTATGLLAGRARVFRRDDRPKRETRREDFSRLGRTVSRPRPLRLYRCC